MIQVNTPNGPRYHTEYFGTDDSLEVQLSRYRFALADRPDMAERWDAIRREYRQLVALLESAE